ncbi:hypothetical protein A0H81_14064 [Grifola frondosa]|uniref:Uncharacterized protein n=1 Tax=Grifola frondosa TaxID=5627 RepID=A0A1C7LMD8_GRIFR|nr:hypothetical protein A0H81_14064 [Grifola frondosa]
MDTHRTVYPYEKVGYSPPQAGPKYGLDEEGEPAEPPPPSYDDPSHFASPVAYPTHYPPPSSGLSDDQGLPHDFQSASPFSPGTPYNSQGVPSTTQNMPYPNRDVLYGNPDGQPGSQSALYVDRGASYRRIAYDNHGGPSMSREYWQRSQGMVHDNQDSPYTIQGMPFTSQGIQSTSHEQRHATYGVPHADQSDYLHRAASIAESTVSCYAPAPPSSVSSSDTSSMIGSRSIYSRSDTGSTTTLESVKSRTPVARSASMRSSPLIDSPPSSLQRSIPRNLSYAPFPPSALLAHSANLEDGFPILPPPSSVVPHPFVSHDVNERDWARFLSDVQSVETLAPVNRIVAGAAPMAVNFGIVGGASSGLYGSLQEPTCSTQDT